MDSGTGSAQPPAAAANLNPSAAQSQPQPQPHSSSAAAAAASYYTNPNPNLSSIPAAGHEAYVPHGAYGNAGTVAYSYPAAAVDTGVELAYYYGAVANPQQYGFDPYLAAPVVPGSSNGIGPTPQWGPQPARPLSRTAMRNRIKKKAKKLVIPAYCEVCKIDCNSADVLVTHKQGKKHKKNLQKLQDSITPKPVTALISILPKAPIVTAQTQQVPVAPIVPSIAIAGQELSKKKKNKKKGALDTPEEFEAKKRRVLEAGAASEAVRVCSICNVVVNDQKVFLYHMAGQKHAAMVKKHQTQAAAAAS